MTYLAIRRICDDCFFSLCVLTDNICGTGFDACPAADAAFNKFYGHNFLFSSLLSTELAIPMHYGSIIGTDEDAKEFVELCKEGGVNAQILEKEK